MNKIILKGIIKNISFSHYIQDIEYYKANLIVSRDNLKEDIISLKFKRFSCNYKENEQICLTGNVRTYSQKLEDKNKVDMYVFTYFDSPTENENFSNLVQIDGKICKKNPIRKTNNGKDVLDFILANNIENNGECLNVYTPMVAWGKCAKALDKLEVGTKIYVEGQLQSREYKKKISDTDYDIRICHEISVNTFKTV